MSKKQRIDLQTPLNFDDSLDSLETRVRFGLGFDAFYEMVELARNPSATISQKIRATEIVMNYLYPKQKPTSPTPGEGEVIEVNIISSSDPRAKDIQSRIFDKISKEKSEDGETV